MKKILLAAALAGVAVGAFASLSFAAPLPARIDNGPAANVITVDYRCGPDHHFMHGFRDRFGHWIPGRCIRDHHDNR